MCEYCETDYKVLNKTKEYSDIEISLYTAIKGIRVRAIFDDTGLFKTQDVVSINYCPMCGRDLKNNKDVKSANNYLSNKLEEENELRKNYLVGEAHELLTRMIICEEDIRHSRELSEELERQKMLNLFKKENK